MFSFCSSEVKYAVEKAEQETAFLGKNPAKLTEGVWGQESAAGNGLPQPTNLAN